MAHQAGGRGAIWKGLLALALVIAAIVLIAVLVASWLPRLAPGV
jgi:hypothetical protein